MTTEPSAEAQEADLGKILAQAFLAQLVERLNRPDDGSDQQEAWSMLNDELRAAYRRGYERAREDAAQNVEAYSASHSRCGVAMALENRHHEAAGHLSSAASLETAAERIRALAPPQEGS